MEEIIIFDLTSYIDFFLPRFCPACKKKLTESEKFICDECLSSIKRADDDRLKIEFERKFSSSKIISGFTSLFIFEKDKALQSLIHSFKYNKRFPNAKFLGGQIGIELGAIIMKWNIDIIIPVPLHHLKKAERGYNQSEFIVQGLSSKLKITFTTKVVKRTRYTESQTTFNQTEREKNISNAFKVRRKKKIVGKNILMVDDVITTGSTIKECGKALIKSGVKSVYACSVAIAD